MTKIYVDLDFDLYGTGWYGSEIISNGKIQVFWTDCEDVDDSPTLWYWE